MRSRHGTLVANTVSTETFTEDFNLVEVLNRGTVDLYFTVNGSDPAVGGTNCYVVPSGTGLQVEAVGYQNLIIKLISSGTPPYSITADG